MKYTNLLLAFLLLFIAVGCGGGKNIPQVPEPIRLGNRELVKGNNFYKTGCYDQALEHYYKAHQIFSSSDQLGGTAKSLNNIGNIYRIKGDGDSALLFFDEAYGIYMDINNREGAASALCNKSDVYIEKGDTYSARKVLEAGKSFLNESSCLIDLKEGIILTREGEYKKALKYLLQSEKKALSGNISDLASVKFSLGNLMFKTGEYSKSIEYFKAALELDKEAIFYKGIADDLSSIANAYLTSGNPRQATIYFKRSLKVYALLKDFQNLDKNLKQLEEASENSGIDINITKHFIKLWADPSKLQGPCN